MTIILQARQITLTLAAALALGTALPAAYAQTAPPAPKAKQAAKGTARKAPAKSVKAPEPQVVLTAADAEQLAAADKVYYGLYECEFKQTIDIVANTKNLGYVDVKLAKSTWLMKPVLSSTGAIRLEDVYGETLMVQISSKSMLLNVKTGHRLVDDCISPRQRELIEAARAAKAAAAAASAAEAASAPASDAMAASAAPSAAAASAPSSMTTVTPVPTK